MIHVHAVLMSLRACPCASYLLGGALPRTGAPHAERDSPSANPNRSCARKANGDRQSRCKRYKSPAHRAAYRQLIYSPVAPRPDSTFYAAHTRIGYLPYAPFCSCEHRKERTESTLHTPAPSSLSTRQAGTHDESPAKFWEPAGNATRRRGFVTTV